MYEIQIQNKEPIRKGRMIFPFSDIYIGIFLSFYKLLDLIRVRMEDQVGPITNRKLHKMAEPVKR
jgi:hypothetical protein